MARNISVTSMVKNCPITAAETPLTGSTMDAKPMPIWIAMICPATTKAWKNNCREKPSKAPKMICSAISSSPLRSSGCTSGIGGRPGVMTTVMARMKYKRIRCGNRVVPKIGMVMITAPTRNAGSMKLATQLLICVSVSASSDISADDLRNAAVQRQDVLHELLHQPRPGDNQGDQHHQHARQEAQGLFVDLGGGLEYRHNQAHHQARDHQHRDHQGGQPEGITEYVDCDFRSHCISLALDTAKTAGQSTDDQGPAIHQHEQHDLERQGNNQRRQHHHPHGHQHTGHYQVDDQEL